MNTVQIFRGTDAGILQEQVNNFFAEQSIKVIQMLQSESNGAITITIYYFLP